MRAILLLGLVAYKVNCSFTDITFSALEKADDANPAATANTTTLAGR